MRDMDNMGEAAEFILEDLEGLFQELNGKRITRINKYPIISNLFYRIFRWKRPQARGHHSVP
jgi:hypothetical protein